MRKLFGFLLLMWVCSSSLQAQQYSFIQYSGNEGLVQSQVQCISQDSRGYLWCGTLGGVSQFNGREFSN
ncbi:MAG: hypothetical protein KDC12_06575, partial [Flavobacteriales bacterium]|nr:hypothetical protein [Flavobacteriales bacterium]